MVAAVFGFQPILLIYVPRLIGYQLIRPPTIPLSTSNPIGPTRVRSPRSEDLLGDNSENQNDVNGEASY